MNESTIKEIKSIYSSKILSTNSVVQKPDIKALKPGTCDSGTFFNGIIEKLNIIVSK